MAETLENLNTGIVVEEETIHINPMIMFVRMMLIFQRVRTRTVFYIYGLTPVPTTLFKDNTSMRNDNKAVLTKVLVDKIPPRHTNALATDYALDRGALLHRGYQTQLMVM